MESSRRLGRPAAEDRGQALTEYASLLAVVVIVTTAVFVELGDAAASAISDIASRV
jgi:Flp pilus assembly pilin Flp